jgi:hypothetical protein
MPRYISKMLPLAGAAALFIGAEAMDSRALAQSQQPPGDKIRQIRPAELKDTGPKSPNLGQSNRANVKSMPTKPSSSTGSRKR